MTLRGAASLLAAACLSVLAATAQAQSGRQLLARGQQAYEQLDFDAATGLFRGALSAGILDSLGHVERVDLFTRLGAAEVFRGRRDSARSVFRRLVLLSPRAGIDELTYPPEVTSVFTAVKRTTRAVAVEAPAGAELRVGVDRFDVWLYSSSHHQIEAVLFSSGGTAVRTLYRGFLGDSLQVRWDGRDSAGTAVPTDSYFLRVRSSDPTGRVERFVQLPLEVTTLRRDTLAPPRPPNDRFRPERSASARGLQALLGGLVVGTTIAVVPPILSSGEPVSGTRWAVGGSVAIVGLVGYLRERSRSTIPANVAYNDSLRRAWQDSVTAVTAYNARAPGNVLRIAAGPPVTIEVGSR